MAHRKAPATVEARDVYDGPSRVARGRLCSVEVGCDLVVPQRLRQERCPSQRGIGVLITDHNVRETLGICSRAYIVSQGGVIASGTAEEILANPEVREVYLGQDFRM